MNEGDSYWKPIIFGVQIFVCRGGNAYLIGLPPVLTLSQAPTPPKFNISFLENFAWKTFSFPFGPRFFHAWVRIPAIYICMYTLDPPNPGLSFWCRFSEREIAVFHFQGDIIPSSSCFIIGKTEVPPPRLQIGKRGGQVKAWTVTKLMVVHDGWSSNGGSFGYFVLYGQLI